MGVAEPGRLASYAVRIPGITWLVADRTAGEGS
jgi:hypothetical protein